MTIVQNNEQRIFITQLFEKVNILNGLKEKRLQYYIKLGQLHAYQASPNLACGFTASTSLQPLLLKSFSSIIAHVKKKSTTFTNIINIFYSVNIVFSKTNEIWDPPPPTHQLKVCLQVVSI